MAKPKYQEYKQLNLPQINEEIIKYWKENQIFEKSIHSRPAEKPFVFYEGPPSANGVPGIHHVMARTVKDLFCRFKTLQGYRVERKAGWDTHGLPVELEVEKTLGIRKDDIGTKISIADYNAECRKAIMKYTDVWNKLTEQMGYWVNMDDPYVTYETPYMESVWNLLKKFHEKGLLYKGYSIQPYSPAAGTGLSTHELNQPGCYRNVKDKSAVVMFELTAESAEKLAIHFTQKSAGKICIMAWTTTPWTLPSNTALAVGKNIDYVAIATFNPFSLEPVTLILAKALLHKYFQAENQKESLESSHRADIDKKNLPFTIIGEFKGIALNELRYLQLLEFSKPADGDAFRVVMGDFVTTEDGTGIVHIAPSFGADDFRVAKQNGIGSLTLVDKRGRFLPEVADGTFLYGNEFVKEAYLSDSEKEEEFQKQKQILESTGKIKELKQYLSVDDRIILKLQEEGKLFRKETYEHSYPHCWRTDKPVLYYPLDSWFIKTTAYKDRMIALNNTINWKPESTGTGRFGNWLENLVDWNLSRSRYWGIPLPVWRSEAGETKCIGSVAEYIAEIDKAVDAGFMTHNPYKNYLVNGKITEEGYKNIDLHRPFTDEIFLVSDSGRLMCRESDLIDVWFDSGSMPYAQHHYMGEGTPRSFPADFIAEGVDQTRGWFFTLHAIASGLFDRVAFKNVVSNGLVLDKNGNKMSKRLGNAVDPFEMGKQYGFDAVRWYMISNAAPWDNLKFDPEGIVEAQRKFFGTLYNTYGFFALYANVDGFKYTEAEIPLNERPEMDRWILSLLNSLIQKVHQEMEAYEPHTACRAIQDFVNDDLSNWYVRLCRRRFWKGEYSKDKISAYQTLYTCLNTVAILMAPVAPFYADKLFRDLNTVTQKDMAESVHLTRWPIADPSCIDKDLEEKMNYAQRISSMVLSLRKKEKIRVRQPLKKISIPIINPHMKALVDDVKEIILSEVNVKELHFLEDTEGVIKKKVKPDFKKLGPKYGKDMKVVAELVNQFTGADIRTIENEERIEKISGSQSFVITRDDVEILTEDIPGSLVASDGPITVALDIELNEQLIGEGIARDFVNRVQNYRKENEFDIVDRISVKFCSDDFTANAIKNNLSYICAEILADEVQLVENKDTTFSEVELSDDKTVFIKVDKI